MDRPRRPSLPTLAALGVAAVRASVVAAAAGALLGCPSGGGELPDPSEPAGPRIISPQPIPDNATGVSVDPSTLSATVEGDALRVRGTASGPVAGDVRLTLTNLTRSPVGTTFTATLDRSFEVTIPGSLADTYRLEETDAYTLVAHVRFDGTSVARFVDPCFAVGWNAPVILLPQLDVGVTYLLQLPASNRCAASSGITALRAWSEGDADVASLPPPSGTVAAGAEVTLGIPVRATAAGTFSRLVVLTASDGAVSSVRLRGFTR
ncbi:MAG: hypothetical protein U0169_19135 [Polyangiaceae bacterium]